MNESREVELRAMTADSIGLGLKICNVRRDKDYQTIKPIFVVMEQELGQLHGSITMFLGGH